MRTITNTLLTAQTAKVRKAFIKLLFTSYDGGTEVDLSKDSATYGNRILLIDHHEEPYNDYAVVILKNHGRLIPDIRGYWTEIGYGDATDTGNEYAGDGTNGGDESTPRLWVKFQQTVSVAGKLVTILELEGMWAKLRETLLRMGVAPYYEATVANDDFSAAKTPYGILTHLLVNEIDPAMSLNALAEDDSVMDTLKPDFEVNINRPFQYAAEVIYDLVKMTKSYLKPKASLAWEIKYLQTSDAVSLTYSSDTAPKFISYVQRLIVMVPNRIYVFANAGIDGLWKDIVTGLANDTDSQAQYGIVPDVALAASITEKADATARAEAILDRQSVEDMAGELIIPHDCQLELYDKVKMYDARGTS